MLCRFSDVLFADCTSAALSFIDAVGSGRGWLFEVSASLIALHPEGHKSTTWASKGKANAPIQKILVLAATLVKGFAF